MCSCHTHGSCHGCHHAFDRRYFLKGVGAAAATSLCSPAVIGAENAGNRIRVAAVFLSGMSTREIWPYPGFDTDARQKEVLAAISKGTPDIEFVPVTVARPEDLQKAIALKDDVDGYLVYVMTLVWSQGRAIQEIGKFAKPTLIADEFLGGSGVFLTAYGGLCTRKIRAAAVSSKRLEDLALVARQFADVRKPGVTPESFARQCEKVYRETFGAKEDKSPVSDKLSLREIGECVKMLRESSFLIVGSGRAGSVRDFLGAKGRYIGFEELNAFFEKVDQDEASEWARRWTGRSVDFLPGEYIQPKEPKPDAVNKAGGIYLATRELMKKYGTENVTMNCLGGFASGKLAAYPCLGFMQILDDGGQGVCEAMPDDTLSMLMARLLTGRPGFVSDPALDTSKNQIVYAHCVATTKPFGPEGKANDLRIRTLHNRDPRGACAESMLPAGYMTTTFRTNIAQKELIIHQARAVGTLDSEHGCRTKLVGEICGDIGKLFDQWDQFGWHRVTVYGDVKEPLAEFGKALGLKVIEED